jgi:phosphoribosylformylglycinamidine synthase
VKLGEFLERHSGALETLLAHPAFASRFPITSHYCGTVQGNTIAGCGNLQDAAAAVVRLPRFAQDTVTGTVGAAFAAGCEERWVELDPYAGAIHTALKVARRVVAVGGTPLGMTDCLNFGSPTNPSVMRQISDAIDGITLVSRELRIPVVSGNVSLNNQTEGKPIPPTPMLGIVGRVDDVSEARLARLPENSAREGLELYWLSHPALAERLSLRCGLAWGLLAEENADLPEPDLEAEKALWDGLTRLGGKSKVPLCYPVGHGGVLLASLRLAFENSATLTFAAEFLARPAAQSLSEGQAGFLVGLAARDLAGARAAAEGAGLDLVPVGALVPHTSPADPGRPTQSLASLERLRAAWKQGMAPFFEAR